MTASNDRNGIKFNDEDLKLVKERMLTDSEKGAPGAMLGWNEWGGLLRRLELAEAVIAESFDPEGMAHIGFDSWHEALMAWRKAAGKDKGDA